jgi:hypothetical protein
MLEPLTSHTWPTDGLPIAVLGIQVDDLASRLDLPVFAWVVDGLGPARGVACRLPSGRVFGLEEVETSIRYQGVKGPTVWVDAADMADRGIERLLAEILEGLQLSKENIAEVVGPEVHQRALQVAALFASRRQTCTDDKMKDSTGRDSD